MNDEFKKALAKAKAGTLFKTKRMPQKPKPAVVVKVDATALKKRQAITKRLLQLRSMINERGSHQHHNAQMERDIETYEIIVDRFTNRAGRFGLTTLERGRLNSMYRRYKKLKQTSD